ncbi:MAG TPA: 23S rRNA (uracil(1939)-C(5))-methyltransferase RlmD [bacterium]|nr:23S rRNA (uracil(1939)-C(5))-methyltransferase RlmD [bacterium]
MPNKHKVKQTAILTIDKLVFGGEAIGRLDGKVCFVWNALPGEEVEVELTSKKKTHNNGIATKIIKPSPDRIPACEDHYLSCSPWSIMTSAAEQKWKKKIALEAYIGIGKLPPETDLDIVDASDCNGNNAYGYRNKIEYSFWHHDADNRISLAFFQRGKHFRAPIETCLLAEPCINQTAELIIQWLNNHAINRGALKSLIIRSNGQGDTIAALFMREEIPFASYPKLGALPLTGTQSPSQFCGFQVYFSNPLSPAALPTKLLYSAGDDYLITKLNDVSLKFGSLSFFQINVPVFQQALALIKEYLDPSKEIVDFYSGVGAISLPLHSNFKHAVLVDNNEEAIEYAKQNITANQITNCKAVLSESEKIVDLIKHDKIIIFDPPRAGLHADVVAKVLQELPERIIYLSCNISTQARDIQLLSDAYKVSHLKLYNFFPRTPHIESLGVLERK